MIVPKADITVGFVPVGTGNTLGVMRVAGFRADAGSCEIPTSHLLLRLPASERIIKLDYDIFIKVKVHYQKKALVLEDYYPNVPKISLHFHLLCV